MYILFLIWISVIYFFIPSHFQLLFWNFANLLWGTWEKKVKIYVWEKKNKNLEQSGISRFQK